MLNPHSNTPYLLSQPQAQPLIQFNRPSPKSIDQQTKFIEHETKFTKISEYKKSSQKMREHVNNFKDYLSKYGDEGDNQYAYKLVLEFFKSQSTVKNLQQETRTIKLSLHRAMRPLEEIKWKQIPDNHHNMPQKNYQSSNIFMPIPPKPQQNDSQEEGQLQDHDSNDILENSKMIQQLLMKKTAIKQKKNSPLFPNKTQRNIRKTMVPDDNAQYSDNEVYFDSDESDQSLISLEEVSAEEEHEESSNSDSQSYSYSDEDDNIQEFYFDEDYEEDFGDIEEYEASRDLAQLFSSSRHKREESLNRTEYSQMTKQQKEKYFKKLNSDYNKRMKRDERPPLNSEKKRANRRISFDTSVRIKNFNKDSKASDVFITNEKEQVFVRQIWEYDEQ